MMKDEEKGWLNYSERMSTKKHFVISKGNDVLGVFPTLKTACDNLDLKGFPSYWTVIRPEKWKDLHNDIKRYDSKLYTIHQVTHFYNT